MRTLVLALALAGLALAPSATASPSPGQPLVVLAYHVAEAHTTFLSWTPVHDADFYVIYRGASPETMEILGFSREPYFLDDAMLENTQYYGVASWSGSDASNPAVVSTTGANGGDCIIWSGLTGIRVSVENCLS